MWKKILLGLVALLVVCQLFRPTKNISRETPGKNDFLVTHAAPAEVQQLFAVSCYDCHSNHTRYPWYAEIQPAGWWLAWHVADGKKELNLSEFALYSAHRQGLKLDAMIDVLEDHSMPLKSYTLIHRDAKLSEAQVKTLVSWLEDEREKLSD
jgi:hypothetical protein